MTIEEVQELISRGPYLRWLGLQVLAIEKETVEVKASWREEWVANPKHGQTHGGILAALIDFTADLALMHSMGHLVPTVDLRVDYHRLATKGDLTVKGKVVKLGRQLAVCDASIHDEAGKLIASGRGTFITAPMAQAADRVERKY